MLPRWVGRDMTSKLLYGGSLVEWGADPSLPMEAPARWTLWKLFAR